MSLCVAGSQNQRDPQAYFPHNNTSRQLLSLNNSIYHILISLIPVICSRIHKTLFCQCHYVAVRSQLLYGLRIVGTTTMGLVDRPGCGCSWWDAAAPYAEG